jgi:AcrR family transcriptional regulator
MAKLSTSARKQTRRRGDVLLEALLDAAFAELSAVGYAKLTMEGVAARAGTSKSVVYRRWPTRAELVIAALRRRAPMLSGELPDTGTLRGDLLAILRRLSRRLRELGPELLQEAFGSVDSAVFLHARHIGTDAIRRLFARAVARGEVVPTRLTDRVASLPVDLVRHEIFITRAPVSAAILAEIVDDIFLPLVHRAGAKRASDA